MQNNENIDLPTLQQQNNELLRMITDLRTQLDNVTAQVNLQQDVQEQHPPQNHPDPAQTAIKQLIDGLRQNNSDPKSARIPHVEPYDGKDIRRCKEFLLQLHVFFAAQPKQFSTEEQKLAYTVSRLRGDAFKWITPALKNPDLALHSFANFSEKFEQAFGERDSLNSAEDQLRNIKQRHRPARALVAEFQSLRLDVSWNDSALISALYNALDDEVKAEIRREKRPSTLDEYANLAISIDNRLHEFRKEQQRKNGSQQSKQRQSPAQQPVINYQRNNYRPQQHPTPNQVVPMDIDSLSSHPSQLTSTERERRRANNLCGYCGGTHSIDACDRLAQKERSKGKSRAGIATITTAESSPGQPSSSSTSLSPQQSSSTSSGKGWARL